MKHKKKYENKIVEKSRNTAPIRVLYKKTGQPPETKIIDMVIASRTVLAVFIFRNPSSFKMDTTSCKSSCSSSTSRMDLDFR